jgi:dihydroflavonol-4-reductase/farnesol dehydrogenase
MRIVMSGGAGFVGGALARRLRGRGNDVVGLVRSAASPGARALADIGCEVVVDDLFDTGRLATLMAGADGVIHAAGSYRIGISGAERPAMWDANVGTTTRMLDAAGKASVPRIVYVSTVNVFGNTKGKVVDETYRRNPADGFLSWYDETKFRAHEIAEEHIRHGALIVIVMPSQVYGPGDHSGFGEQMSLAHAGRLRYRAVDDVSVGLVHVDDLATGIVAALDGGRIGESYVLSGPRLTLADATAQAAALAGRGLPRLRIPSPLLRLMAPLGRLVGRANLREVVESSAGVTYWANHDKATRELAFTPRDFETGLRDTFGAG